MQVMKFQISFPITGIESRITSGTIVQVLETLPEDFLSSIGVSEIRLVGGMFDSQYGIEVFHYKAGRILYVNAGSIERSFIGVRRITHIREMFGQYAYKSMSPAQRGAWTRLFNSSASKLNKLHWDSEMAFSKMFGRMTAGYERQVVVGRTFVTADAYFRRTFPSMFPKLSLEESAYRSLLKTGGNLRSLSHRLFVDQIWASEAKIRSYLRQYGFDKLQGNVHLLDKKLIARFRDYSSFSSRTLVRTFNNDLAKKLSDIVADYKRNGIPLTAAKLNKEVEVWARWRWNKAERDTYGFGVQEAKTLTSSEFARRSKIVDATLVVVPDNLASCDICKELISGNPYETIDEIQAIGFPPIHVHCVHSVDIKGGEVKADPWLGD